MCCLNVIISSFYIIMANCFFFGFHIIQMEEKYFPIQKSNCKLSISYFLKKNYRSISQFIFMWNISFDFFSIKSNWKWIGCCIKYRMKCAWFSMKHALTKKNSFYFNDYACFGLYNRVEFRTCYLDDDEKSFISLNFRNECNL